MRYLLPRVPVQSCALPLLALLVLSACAGQSTSTAQSIPRGGAVAFTNVSVIPMTEERVLQGQTVIVRDGLIVEMGPAGDVAVPSDATIVDGAGRHLLPGLTDFHIHLRAPGELISYLAHGVTTVVHMSGAMEDAPELLRYREELDENARVGPTLYTTGPILDGNPPVFADVSTVVATPGEGRAEVARQAEAGYDFIKVYNNLLPDVHAEVVEEAHRRGLAVLGHIPRVGGRGTALQRALNAGQDLIAHGEEYFFTYFYDHVDSLLDRGEIPNPDESRIPEVVRLTRESDAAVIPNLSFVAMTRRQLDDLDGVLADPESRYLPPAVREMWEAQNPTRRDDLDRFNRRERAKYPFVRKLTKELSDGGVLLLLGTDASAPGMYPGASAHLELRELVAAGLTPFEALATGTRNAGAFIVDYVAGAASVGTIAPGQRADLLLVQGNPLHDVANAASIEGVMARGQWFTMEELLPMREANMTR